MHIDQLSRYARQRAVEDRSPQEQLCRNEGRLEVASLNHARGRLLDVLGAFASSYAIREGYARNAPLLRLTARQVGNLPVQFYAVLDVSMDRRTGVYQGGARIGYYMENAQSDTVRSDDAGKERHVTYLATEGVPTEMDTSNIAPEAIQDYAVALNGIRLTVASLLEQYPAMRQQFEGLPPLATLGTETI